MQNAIFCFSSLLVVVSRCGLFALTLLVSICQEAFAEDCASLGNYDCRHSTTCTLDCVQASPKQYFNCQSYRCVPKLDSCEAGLAQAGLKKEVCEARQGCEFRPGGCYCTCVSEADDPKAKAAGVADCVCECAHGPASACRKKSVPDFTK